MGMRLIKALFLSFAAFMSIAALSTEAYLDNNNIGEVSSQLACELTNSCSNNAKENLIEHYALSAKVKVDNEAFTKKDELLIRNSFWLSVIAIIATLISIISILIYSHLSKEKGDVLKMISVTVVVFASLILITGGFSGAQINSVIGLFGTALGYVLASAKNQSTEKKGD